MWGQKNVPGRPHGGGYGRPAPIKEPELLEHAAGSFACPAAPLEISPTANLAHLKTLEILHLSCPRIDSIGHSVSLISTQRVKTGYQPFIYIFHHQYTGLGIGSYRDIDTHSMRHTEASLSARATLRGGGK